MAAGECGSTGVDVDRADGVRERQSQFHISAHVLTSQGKYNHSLDMPLNPSPVQGNIKQTIMSNTYFIIELFTSMPLILSVRLMEDDRVGNFPHFQIFIPYIRRLYVPSYLNLWLARLALQTALSDRNRGASSMNSVIALQIVSLASTIICILVTG
jgi:hypothetical protein